MPLHRSIFPIFLVIAVAFAAATSPVPGWSQNQLEPNLFTNVLTERVALGEFGQLYFKLVGGDFQMPQQIEAQGLEVIHSGKQSNVVIKNGVQTIETSHFYRFRGDEPGTFTIPAVPVRFRDRELSTKPVEITVFERDANDAIDATRPYFGKLELPKSEFYVNELLPFTLTAFVRGRNSINEIVHVNLDHESFVIRPFRRVNTDGSDLGNTYYSSATIPSAMFALKPGSHRLGPADIAVRTIDANSSFGFSSFFNRTVVREMATNTVNVTVKPLPNNAPKSFTGGVGTFAMTAKPSLTELSVGDPLTMEFTVTGKGNLGTMGAPVFKIPQTDLWRTYEAAKKLEDETDSDGFSEGTAIFSQVIIPEAKVDTIPAFELTYFDPENETYETISSPTIPVSVRADTTATPATPISNTQVTSPSSFSASTPEPAYDDMLHIRTGGPRWLAAGTTPRASALYWIVQGLFSIVFFTIASYGIIRWWKARSLSLAAREDFTTLLSRVPSAGAPRRDYFRHVARALDRWKTEHPDAPEQMREVVSRVQTKCDAIVYGNNGQPDGPVSRDEAEEYRSILQRLPRK